MDIRELRIGDKVTHLDKIVTIRAIYETGHVEFLIDYLDHPIEFKEQNVVFAKDQKEYKPLPALVKNDAYGTVVTCWKMSFRDRIKALVTGRIWVYEASFNKPLTPILISTTNKEIF